MKILIGQPIHEEGIDQITREVEQNKGIDFVLYPEGYLSDETAFRNVCCAARENNVSIVTSYKKESKHRAVIINSRGQIVLERAKTPPDEDIKLYSPLVINYYDKLLGYILCMEILKGIRDLKALNINIDLIFHSIGVGMFSEEQFDLWITEAKNIARAYKTVVIGTSHADGSYRNCGISIPIAYCINSDGEPIFISKSDTRSRIVNLETKSYSFAD